MSDVPQEDRVWIEHKKRWYPAILDRWDSKLRFHVKYAVPVNGWPGGRYDHVLGDDGDDPNGDSKGWVERVEAAREESLRLKGGGRDQRP